LRRHKFNKYYKATSAHSVFLFLICFYSRTSNSEESIPEEHKGPNRAPEEVRIDMGFHNNAQNINLHEHPLIEERIFLQIIYG